MTIKELRSKAMSLPLNPGVYIMKDKSGKIIYIGKAKALKNRVSSYFGSQNNHSEKVKRMVENVDDFEYILTNSEFEALILECSLIKQNMPKYNILLKDDKGYSYIKITNDIYPKISFSMQKDDPSAEYLGPYISPYFAKKAVAEAQKIYKLHSCNKNFSRDIKKSRPCLNFHINQCLGLCRGNISPEEYKNVVNEAIDFLKNDKPLDLKKMTEEMTIAAENLEFEKAARIRDRIKAIQKINEDQKVVDVRIPDQDIISFAGVNEVGCFSIIRFENHRLFDKEDFIIKDIDDINSAHSEFIKRYYSMRDKIPPFIFIDKEIEDKSIIEQWLTQKSQKSTKILLPKKGEQAKLISMCKLNATEKLAKYRNRSSKTDSVLQDLAQILGLKKIPEYIEAYDISNLAGDSNVAGMVVYKNGEPLKSAYRKFKIKSFDGQDDYGSMAEVLSRRLTEYQNATTENGFGKLPDLILLDGGKGQVSAVRKVLNQFGYDIPLFGMVKDNRHRTRAITDEGQEISISLNKAVFNFITRIQDEVHRFAIGYHRADRKNKTFKSSLTDIPGIGEGRAKLLLKRFKTISNIQNADLNELLSIKGMTKDSANSVYDYFHNNN